MEENTVPPATLPSSTSRWSPTKEQIGVLEGLYREGVRTPTAEQIQQITGKLRTYGRIEGKNVFYWFQNHKARQRQKQKQQRLRFFARFLRRPAGPPVPSPSARPPPPLLIPALPPTATTDAIVRGTPGMQRHAPGLCFYPPAFHFHGVFLPAGPVQMGLLCAPHVVEMGAPMTPAAPCAAAVAPSETLPLFPLHPTGIRAQSCVGSHCSVSSEPRSSAEGQSGGSRAPLPTDFFGRMDVDRSSLV